MSDPVGSVGQRRNDPALDELALAYKGGPGFSARLEQLSAARDAHDKAFAKLGLGNDVLAQRQAAQAQIEFAKQKTADAEAVLAKAKADAAATRRGAEEDANEMRAKATAFQLEKERAAAAKMAAADKHVEDAKADAKVVKATAEDMLKAAAEQLKTAQLQASQHASLASAAEAKTVAAVVAEKTFRDKLAKLDAMVRELHGS